VNRCTNARRCRSQDIRKRLPLNDLENIYQQEAGAQSLIIAGVEARQPTAYVQFRYSRGYSTEDAVNTGERKERRGFASMSPEKQREIASKGGRAAHEKGTAHEWTADEARNAGRKGGQVSRGGRGRLVVPSADVPAPAATPAPADALPGSRAE
jgi:uncharacterized protein